MVCFDNAKIDTTAKRNKISMALVVDISIFNFSEKQFIETR